MEALGTHRNACHAIRTTVSFKKLRNHSDFLEKYSPPQDYGFFYFDSSDLFDRNYHYVTLNDRYMRLRTKGALLYQTEQTFIKPEFKKIGSYSEFARIIIPVHVCFIQLHLLSSSGTG